jgi:hypothetical protein
LKLVFLRKSPFETSTLEDTWLILIGQKSESPLGLIDFYPLLYLFLLEIIINYKCPTIIGRNTYLDSMCPSDTWQFLIFRFNDTWHHLICSLIFNLINLVTYVNLGFVTKFDVAICNWPSNFCFLQMPPRDLVTSTILSLASEQVSSIIFQHTHFFIFFSKFDVPRITKTEP